MRPVDARLCWGILGPGRIADHFAAAIGRCASGKLTAVGSRDPSRSDLAGRFPGSRIHRGYESLLEDEGVDVVYIATPHPLHCEWAIRAARAGKHVLCEKPFAMDIGQAEAMFAAAREAGTFMGEAFMYRFHPLTAKLLDLLRGGLIGTPTYLESTFAFPVARDLSNRRLFEPNLGGGGILDLGVYPVSMARLIAGVHSQADFADPAEVKGVASIGVSGVDECAAAVLSFPCGLIAQLACGITIRLGNVLRIFGERGRLEVSEFWFGGGFGGGQARIRVQPGDGEAYDILVDDHGRGLYDYEVDATAEAIAAGRREFAAPGMSWADTLGNLRAVDLWRASAGIN